LPGHEVRERDIMRICGILLVLVLIMCVGPVSAAIGLDMIPVSPSGDLTGGETQAESSFILNFIASSGEKSPLETLELDTGLMDPEWTVAVLEDDRETIWTTATTSHLVLRGDEQKYPASGKIPVRITLQGKAPVVTEPKSIEVIRVTVVPGYNSLVETRTVVPGSGADDALIAGPVPATVAENEMTAAGTHGPAGNAGNEVSPGDSIFDRILSFISGLFG
jgi:hypothetical protein